MKFILNTCTDAYLNLALEEAFTKTLIEEPILMLWRNKNAVIIGRHQNTLEEINMECIEKNNISVVRRNSGGGAVYHDLGNINFSVIFGKNLVDCDDMSFATSAVLEFLKSMKVPVSIEGRNDITCEGKKISGIAKYITKENILYHGTLLFDIDVDMMTSALSPNIKKLQSKAVKSIRARVGNIKDLLYIGREEFFSAMSDYFLLKFGKYEIADNILIESYKLRANKYITWDWNYGNSPLYNYKNEIRTDGGIISVAMLIENGIINECSIRGDFFSKKDIADLESVFIGLRHDQNLIYQKIKESDIESYFNGISENDIMQIMSVK